MEVKIGIGNTRDANLFLRALWAEFRKECGKCAWQYTPYKDGQKQRVFIGFADINRPEGTIGISVTYAERGTIRSIRFDDAGDCPIDPKSELAGFLQQSVNAAEKKRRMPDLKFYSVTIEGLYVPPRHYRGDSFSFEPISKRRFSLALAVYAFDKTDAEPEIVRKVRQVLNVLSVETNSAFWPLNAGQVEEDEPLAKPLDKTEVFSADLDWMDDCPVQDDQLLISREAMRLIDTVPEMPKSID